jgi:hypothetical protein
MQVHTLTWLLSPSLASIVTATALVLRNATVTRGIDLFEIHLPVNWKTAVAEGVEFVFVKVGDLRSFYQYPDTEQFSHT